MSAQDSYPQYELTQPHPTPPDGVALDADSRPRWLVPGLIAGFVLMAAIAAAITVIIHTSDAPTSFTATGSLTLTDSDSYGVGTSIANLGGSCEGTDGYSDLREGAQVSIADQAGAVVAVGQLESGSSLGFSTCQFPFTVPNVPTGKKFYGFTVTHRGTIQYTEQQVRDGVSLSIGS